MLIILTIPFGHFRFLRCQWYLFEWKQRGFIMEEDQGLDPYKHLKIAPNHDGTITRLRVDPPTSPASDPNLPISVLTKDIIIIPEFNVSARIFVPRKALDNSSPKLPLILYFHGGGFILFSAASSMFHDFCINMANDVQAIVLSLDYRLAPDHRLPAAYDDAMQALHWIQTNHDDWLGKYADLSSSYLMGSSSGANIAYHAGLRVVAESEGYDEPLKIRGLILVQPFVGGMERRGSELRLVNDPVLPLCVTDLMWELSLPVGSNRDHEYCNPMAGRDDEEKKKKMQKMRVLGWRVMVIGCEGDPLVDRQKEMVTWMEENGVKVEVSFEDGYNHGAELRNALKQKELFSKTKTFVGS
ncbi:carboxylesterase 1-like [Neltuma alba]|uniref:carboxylesterase 1-like n=1 Tax=Neltuma alba TaxID=207710 RepID=UPI0010A487A0|nr:carboxylesterase 1-like [Prosopis alba]XP_028768543.1 carboxylesterase 1-like [Prosopis alba]